MIIDERFLQYRLKATSIAGILGIVVAMGLFSWHYYHDHIWNWDLLSVGITMAASKQLLLLWFRLKR